MPNSSDALVGRYNPKRVLEQRASRASVQVDVNELKEIPSISTGATNSKKFWIIGCLATLTALAVGAGVATPFIIKQSQGSTSNGGTSSNISLANNASNTTAGSSNSNSTTLSTTSVHSSVSTTVSSGSNTNTTVSTASTASTTVSTSSVSSSTTLAAGFSAGGTVLSSTTAWYGDEEVDITCTTNLQNITITIYVQKTVGATYNGAFSTFWSGTINQANLDNGTQIIYTWTIASGQTIQASGSPYRVQAQFSLHGTNQVTSADIFTVIATTVGGVTSSLSGHF